MCGVDVCEERAERVWLVCVRRESRERAECVLCV